MKKAAYSLPYSESAIQCVLCPHHCILTEGKRGLCLTRQNRGGELISLNYCKPVTCAIDPIEKKPLYHFYPDSRIFSTGPNGCNFQCLFCQNADIAQTIMHVNEVPLQQLVQQIIQSNTIGVAYTYSEPYIWFETIMDVAPLIKQRGLKNVMVTNGFMEPQPLAELLTVIDAMNIDIKSMRKEFYKKLCKATLESVLRTCETVKKHCHLEITNLIIPGENDTREDLYNLAHFISDTLGRDTPLHLSRYFPRHKMHTQSTDESVLRMARETASELLDYVYVGNIEIEKASNTYCPSCHSLLIQRTGNTVQITDALINDVITQTAHCRKCTRSINVII